MTGWSVKNEGAICAADQEEDESEDQKISEDG